jgi:hypothetical protein
MSFLAPLFFIGATAAAIPIVLHLLKRQPEARVKFAPVRLLRQAPVEHTQRRHLRELLLLALRVAALILLALAFARPFFAAGPAGQTAGVTIVALDTSVSLSAPGQFERAKAIAKEAIDRAPEGDLIGVLTFDYEARVSRQPSADRALARSAVDAATTTFGATRYSSALNRAAALLDGRRGTIVVVTDLQEGGWDRGDRAVVPESADVRVADVGAPPPNVALVAVRAADDRVVATVRNAGPQAREVRVRLTVDGRAAAEGTAAIGPDQTSEVVLAAPRGIEASATVEDPAGVQADNVRYLVLDNATRPVVLIITANADPSRDAFYVLHALAAEGAGGARFQVAGAAGAALSAWDQPRLSHHAAVVLLSTRGIERRGRELLAEYARQGGGVLVAVGPGIDREVAAEILSGAVTISDLPDAGRNQLRGGGRAFVPVDGRHPLFRAFGPGASSLGLVTFTRIASVRAPGCQTLARFTSGENALVECAAGEGRALVLASDLNAIWNDFPRRPTFVPFLQEAVRYLSGAGPRVGEYLVGFTPRGLAGTPGIATLAASDGTSRRVAVNIDPVEANPARLTPQEFQAAVTRLHDQARVEGRMEDRQREESQHLWQWVLGAMLAAMIVESVVASRTA